MKYIYSTNHLKIFDNIVVKKRIEILNVIINSIEMSNINSVLDIGTTADEINESSNILIKNLGKNKIVKLISDQVPKNLNYKLFTKKSITDNFSSIQLKENSADLVISSATIEHVGVREKQLKMIENIINLSNKYFVITTPNKFHPIDFHTKIPLIHMNSKIHKFILNLIGLDYFAKKENLNLLSKRDILDMLNKFKNIEFEIKTINLFLFKSNFIIIGKLKSFK